MIQQISVFCGKCNSVQPATKTVVEASEDRTSVYKTVIVECNTCFTLLSRITSTRPRRLALSHALGRRV